MSATTLEGALVTQLLAATAVAALIGTRLYPQKAPQGTAFPFVTYQGISRPRTYTTKAPVGLTMQRLQYDAWGLTYADAYAAAAAVLAALDGFAGTIAGTPFVVRGSFIEDQSDEFEPPIHAEDVGAHRVRLDVSVWA